MLRSVRSTRLEAWAASAFAGIRRCSPGPTMSASRSLFAILTPFAHSIFVADRRLAHRCARDARLARWPWSAYCWSRRWPKDRSYARSAPASTRPRQRRIVLLRMALSSGAQWAREADARKAAEAATHQCRRGAGRSTAPGRPGAIGSVIIEINRDSPARHAGRDHHRSPRRLGLPRSVTDRPAPRPDRPQRAQPLRPAV